MVKRIPCVGKILLIIFTIFLMPVPRVLANGIDVLFINPGRTGETFWDMVSDFMKAASNDLDINLKIVTAERDHLMMAKLAKDAASSDAPPDYMILVNEKRAAGKLLPELPQNIKVIMLNNGLSKSEEARYGQPRGIYPNWLASVVPDHKQAGSDIIEALIAAEAREISVRTTTPIGLLAVGGNRVTLASQLRLQGMREFLSGNALINLQQTIYSEWRRDKAESQIFGLLRRWPKTRLIWAANDRMALGALGAAKRRNLIPEKDIYIGGLNWSREALQKIKNEEMSVTVGGHFMLGGWALVLIHDRENGRDFRDLGRVITFPMYTITRDNIFSYLNVFGEENWKKVNFRRLSRTQDKINNSYDFSLSRLLAEATK